MEFKKGDFIQALDEDYIYQIQGISALSIGDSYMCKNISRGHSRGFDVNAKHYRRATEQEVQQELESAPKHFPFWVTNKKNVVISNGHIFAPTIERAREIFKSQLIELNNVGEYFMSETPLTFIEE
ncbi:hypothetical protein [Cytobacillus sp. IB215665]|uniref:hypothetical protein n=1 Tax=Cytobacillus sp. IB215665 TaxID=3097357 RepID=UPI002A128ACA|nr:hypothetical protein [Cytobacillus sp. IB215665]MDX8367711.1 hypothetical protein [Cytobacillus sp. IB215665]